MFLFVKALVQMRPSAGAWHPKKVELQKEIQYEAPQTHVACVGDDFCPSPSLRWSSPLALTAETNCEEGNGRLNSAQPQNISVQDLIQKFAQREAIFKEARNHYTYTQEVSVETLDGDTVDGQFKETTDVLYDDQGKRIENVTYAPMNTLTRVMLTKEDSTISATICRLC